MMSPKTNANKRTREEKKIDKQMSKFEGAVDTMLANDEAKQVSEFIAKLREQQEARKKSCMDEYHDLIMRDLAEEKAIKAAKVAEREEQRQARRDQWASARDNLKSKFKNIYEVATSKATMAVDSIKNFGLSVPSKVADLGRDLKDKAVDFGGAVKEKMTSIGSTVKEKAGNIKRNIPAFFENIKSKLTDVAKPVASYMNYVKNLGNDLKSGFKAGYEAYRDGRDAHVIEALEKRGALNKHGYVYKPQEDRSVRGNEFSATSFSNEKLKNVANGLGIND